MRLLLRHLLGVGVLVLAACVHTNAVRLGNAPALASIAPDRVVVYRTAAQVPGPYQEIALLNAKGEGGWTNEDGMVSSMKKKAGELGANAIILDAMSEPSAGAKVAAAFLGTGAEWKGKAIAICIRPSSSATGSQP